MTKLLGDFTFIHSIAIIGGGISGLAAAHRCLKRGIGKIVIFDAHEPGCNPHTVEAALMHPLPGLQAKPIPNYEQLQNKTLELLQIAQTQSQKPIYSTCGLFRIASTPERAAHFQRAASSDPFGFFPEKSR